jgi:hypothetical protein
METDRINQQPVVTPETVDNSRVQNNASPIMSTTTAQKNSNTTLYIILGVVGVIILCCLSCCVFGSFSSKFIPLDLKMQSRQTLADQINKEVGYLSPGQKPYDANTICNLNDENVFPSQIKNILCN